MNKVTCIVVDDEKLAREGVALLLSQANDFEVLDLCANGKQAIESILHYEPNLVFLDIQMPDIDGFEVLKSLPADKIPIIIFITAYDKYAIKAFEASAFDYLLKPFDDERFDKVLERAKNYHTLIKKNKHQHNVDEILSLLANANNTKQLRKEEYIQRIMVKRNGGVKFIDTKDVISLEASDYYVKIITRIDEHLMRKSLNNFEEKLDPSKFVRIHRGTIINIDYISQIEHFNNDEYIALISNGKKYRISKSGRKKLDKRFRL